MFSCLKYVWYSSNYIQFDQIGFAGVLLTALHKHLNFFFKNSLLKKSEWRLNTQDGSDRAIREWAIMITRNRHVSKYRHVSHVGVVPGINT